MQTAVMESPNGNPPPGRSIGLFNYPECEFHATGLVIPLGMKFERWEQLGADLRVAAKGVQFWIGDWIRYGEHTYGEKYAQAIEATGLEGKTLRNYVYVAEHIEMSRRRDNVDFTTHAEVASLPPAEQEKILSRAALDSSVTAKDVRKEARRAKRKLNLIPDEVDLLHSPVVQEYLDGYIDGLKMMDEAVPSDALFLHGMIQSHIGQALWQKERTVESDCAAILDTFDEVYTQTDQDIYKHLTSSGHFISDPDLDDRLDLMIKNRQLKKVKTGGRQETRRGDMVDLYMLYDAPTGDAANVRKGSSVYDMGERE